MSIPHSAAEILDRHVELELECTDRLYLNLYVPILQDPRGVAFFWRKHRGYEFASSALMAPMSRSFIDKIESFADREGVDLITFRKDQRKDDIAREYLARFDRDEGVLFIGKAQEKAKVIRTERRHNPTTGAPYAWLVSSTSMVNQYYFYCVDKDFGPFFFVYDISILQGEFSLTQVFDRPRTGRLFFEEIIRENVDLGRPDHVQLIFGRRITRRTPARFRTRVITDGVIPSLHVDYKSNRIKQYHKEGRALRTETIINDTYDFKIGRRLENLPALRQLGLQTNRRLLGVQRISHDCAIGEAAFEQIHRPSVVDDQRASALRLDDARARALLAALLIFHLLPRGFTNQELREHVAPLLGLAHSQYTQGKMSYDLRRLRLHGLIVRIPGSRRYRVTTLGFRAATFLTRAYNRLLRHGLAVALDPDPPRLKSPLRAAFENLDHAVDDLWSAA